jgi:hypothetical protein
MAIERKSRDQIWGLPAADIDRYLDQDVLIRSGMCPNGCGLMHEGDDGQHCMKCNFMCNTLPEKQAQN